MTQLTNLTTDAAVLTEIGKRFAQLRLNQNLSQAALAEKAGLTRLTVHKIESGANVNFNNVVRLMRALGILGNLGVMVPDLAPSPIQQADAELSRRRRASPSKEDA